MSHLTGESRQRVEAKGRAERAARRPAACATAARAVLVGILSLSLIGCGIIERLTGEAARKRARAEAAKEQSQTLQLKVMRFADQYVERMERRTTQLARKYAEQMAEHDFDVDRLVADLAQWRFTQATAAFQIAAGSNPVANAIDMIVLVSLTRRIIEFEWVQTYGPAAADLLRTFRSLEDQAWHLVDDLPGTTEDKKAEFDRILQDWYQSNPGLESAAFVRFTDIAGLGLGQQEAGVSPGLLGIFGLDPLEGVDPAVREFEQTRVLAERAMYYAQRVSILIDLQVTASTARARGTPEVRETLETVDQVGRLADALAGVVGELPNTIAREREAAVAQVMAELYSQQREMLALTQELRGVLDAGTVTAQSLEELVDSTDRLMARFEPDPDAPKPTEPPRPFDINEYTRTVTELAATAREFQALVQDVDALTPKLTEPMDQLTGRVRDLVDYAFSRALLAILALLLAAIVYQVFANRLKRRTPPA
jgi:hypothetical protein